MKSTYKILTEDISTNKKERIFEIDFLRCLPIFIVMLYHLAFDFSMVPLVTNNYYSVISNYPNLKNFINFCYQISQSSLIIEVFAPLVGGLFLFICGISTSFSRNNLRRGLLLLVGSLIITSATWILDIILEKTGNSADIFISFGILHLMAISILFYSPLELIFKLFKKKVPAFFMLALGIIILMVGIFLNCGIQLSGKEIIWPNYYSYGDPLSQIKQHSAMVFFYSAIGKVGNTVDWWPIFPYAGVIYIGIGIGKILYKEKKSVVPHLNFKILKPFNFIGRHTIYFYLLHQVVFVSILAIVFYCLGFRI